MRKVPQRQCVACGRVRPKRDLVRVVRTPAGDVRVDVTGAVRAWQTGTTPPEGLALLADGGEVVFTGSGAAAPSDRPRLEVLLR